MKKKLVENITSLQLGKNDLSESEGDFKFNAIVAHADIVNDNGFILDGDVIEFEREKYPFLFNHSDNELLGEVRTHFDDTQRAYVSDITIYESKSDIIKAIKNGVYDSVSISYYFDEFNFGDNDELIVKHAIMCEVSLVSVGADRDAKIVANELKEKHRANILAENKLREIKKAYE